MHVDIGVTENCKNPDSYGVICVWCNECGRFNNEPLPTEEDNESLVKELKIQEKKTMCELKEMRKCYETNDTFRRFVDENAKGYGKDPSYILQTQTTREYYKSIQKGCCNEPKQMDFGFNPWQE